MVVVDEPAELVELLSAAMEACASAEQRHGSKWTRAAWTAVVSARYVAMTSCPGEPRGSDATE